MTSSTPTTAPTRPDASPRPSADDGDHDRYAHYVRAADLDRAWLDGRPIRALCGKEWVPTRDPSRYPVCPACAELRALLTG